MTQAMRPGTSVRYWTGAKAGEPRTGSIKHPFSVQGMTVVGWVDSHRAYIAASHIDLI